MLVKFLQWGREVLPDDADISSRFLIRKRERSAAQSDGRNLPGGFVKKRTAVAWQSAICEFDFWMRNFFMPYAASSR